MVIEFIILFKVAYFATQSIDSPMAVILFRGSLFNKNLYTHLSDFMPRARFFTSLHVS